MTVRIEKAGPVWTIIHDRPAARNAMDPDSADALTTAFLEFDADKDASVAVFYGAGGAFCAGWDLKYVSSLNAAYPLGELDISTARPRGNGGEIPRGPLGPSRLELDKPVIAAIEGPAGAGGNCRALWGRVARSRLSLPDARCLPTSACRSACASTSPRREEHARRQRLWHRRSRAFRRFAFVPTGGLPSRAMGLACARV